MASISRKICTFVCAAVLSVSTIVSAASSTTQGLSITPGALEDISVSGSVTIANEDFSYNDAGSHIASDATTTLDYFMNSSGTEITAVSDTAFGSGMTVTVGISGGTATGSPSLQTGVALTDSAATVVSSAQDTALTGATITYNVTVSSEHSGSAESKTITWAIASP